MSGVPYTFGNATTSIPLSQLDVNFATNATLGNATVGLGNTTTTVGNLTVSNISIVSTNGDANVHGITVGLGNSSVSTNTAVGTSALQANTSGANNIAVGYQAGYTNSTGVNNAFFGWSAGYSNTTGEENTFIGNYAGYAVTTGIKNTIIGRYSGNQGGLDIRTSSNYIVLSDGDGNPRAYWDASGNFTNSAASMTIANGTYKIASQGSGIAYMGFVTSSAALQMSFNSVIAGVSLGSGATSWGSFSDSRLKDITGTYTNALSDIAQIQPVKFTWKNDSSKKPYVGVIAQSVQNVVPESVDSMAYVENDTTEYLQVRYTELIPLMIASIQELKAELDTAKAEIAALQAKVGA